MVWFLGGTAVLCLLYYIIIVIYSGVSTSFALIWPCLAIFLGLLAAGWWFGSQHEGRIPCGSAFPSGQYVRRDF